MPYNLTAEGADENRNVPYGYAPGFPVIAPPTAPPPAGGGTAVAPKQLTWDEWARRAPTATGVAPPPTPAPKPGAGGIAGARWTPDPSDNFGLNMMVSNTGENPLPEIANRVEADAAKNGLTAWGYSLLRQLGRTIKPEWLKESSKEWFNKELPEPWIPPKEEFIKFVEPFAGQSQFGASKGVNQLRAKYGLDVDSTWKGREYVLDQNRKTPELLDPGRVGNPAYRTPPNESAIAEMDRYKAARSAFEKENPMPPMGTPLGEYDAKWREFQKTWKPGTAKSAAGTGPAALTAGGTPITEPTTDQIINPGFGKISEQRTQADIDAAQTFLFGSAPARDPNRVFLEQKDTGGTNNFLPPYLQPGQGTGKYQPPQQGGSLTPTSIQTGTPQIPSGVPATVTPPGSPMTPFVPPAAAAVTPPGSPVQPFVPDVAKPKTKGGFASAAKTLELPFYLRQRYG